MAVDPSRTFTPINIAVLTISDTRTLEDDTSGAILAERVTAAGHNLVTSEIEKDVVDSIVRGMNNWIDEK